MTELIPIDVILSSGEANGEATTNLDSPIFTIDEIPDVVGVTVLQASVPFSYYVFDNLTNQFRITVTGGSTPAQSTYTCTIAPGSYTSVNLIPQIIKAFATSVNSTGSVVDIAAAGFTAWVDVSTSTLVIYTTGASTTFTVNFGGGINSAHRTIGYYGAPTVTATNAATTPLYDNNDVARTSGYYAISPFSVSLSGDNILLLHSNLAGSVYGTVRTHTNASDILQFMTVNNNYQGMIEWMNPDTKMKPMTKTTISRMSFYLTLGFRSKFKAGSDETNYLQLQGQPFQLVLRFFRINDAQIDYRSNSLGDKYMVGHSQNGSTQQPFQTRPEVLRKRMRQLAN